MNKESVLLKNMFASSPDIIVMVDSERSIIGFNKSAQRAFGYYDNEVMGKSVDILYANRREARCVSEELKKQNYFCGEVTNIRKNGQTFISTLSASELLDEDGNFIGYMGISRDITRYKEAETLLKASNEKLRESEKKYNHLFQIESASILVFDAVTGAFLDANDSTFALYGYSKDEFFKLTYKDILYEKKDFTVELKYAISGGCVHVPFCRHVKKNGTMFPVDMVAGAYVYKEKRVVCAIVRDITLKKRTEERLELLNKVFLSLGSDYNENIMLLVRECGRLLFACESFYCKFKTASKDTPPDSLENPMVKFIYSWHLPGNAITNNKTKELLFLESFRNNPNGFNVIRGQKETDNKVGDVQKIGGNYGSVISNYVCSFGNESSAICVVYKDDYIPDDEDREVLEITAAAIKIEEIRKVTNDALKDKSVELEIANKELEDERRIFYGGPVVVFKRTVGDGFSVEYVSSNVEEILGYKVEDFLKQGTSFLSLVFDEDMEHIQKEIKSAINKGFSCLDLEYRVTTKGNKTLWVCDYITIIRDSYGVATHLFGYLIDITRRREMETALRESEEMFRILAEGSLSGVLLYHDTFVYANPAAENITGYNLNELSNMAPWEILHDDFKAKGKELALSRVSGYKLPAFYNNAKIVRKNGEYKWAQLFTNTIEHKGQYLGLATIVDITERVKFEQELQETSKLLHELNANLERRVINEVEKRRQKEQLLIQQSKLASMGEMIGAIAHQWRQPLNALSILIQDIEDAYQFGELNEQYIMNHIKNCMEQIDFMSRTVDDFRQFFTPSKEKIVFNPKSAIDEVLSLLTPQFRQLSIVVNYHVDMSQVYKVLGYPNEFKQVILNILTNAKDVLSEKERKEIDITIHFKDNKTSIEIGDSGGGIEKQYMQKIFDPYFTTKEKGHGTGIGLYMSKTIIEDNMNGKITAKNHINGALFTIELPDMVL